MTLPALARLGSGGRFELRPLERKLLVDGVPATLGARAFDLLLALVARPGEMCTRGELIEAVWPGVVVEDGNLPTQIGTLRKVLGNEAIATLPGRGYQFTLPVEAGAGPASPSRPAAAAPPTPPAPPTPEKLRTNLPAVLQPLIGRADDLAALAALVGQHRLVSVVGAGGIGKTALARAFLHARREAYPHGVCWVDLAPVTDPAAVPGAVIAALGLAGGGSDALKTLCALCAPLQLLLALDNAEHLRDATAQVAQALVEAAPGVRVVVTSQATLNVAAEQVYRLGVLETPPGALPALQARRFSAVALFESCATKADARWQLDDDNAADVIGLCRQLDGLPLAIELAAARAPVLGVQRLSASMADRLRLLTRGNNRLAPPRQQTLRAALAWSHDLLGARERTVFRRLAVFAGSGSLSMVRQVVSDPEGELDAWAVLDALVELIDRSLVVARFDDGAPEPRYCLLESPRAFALERLRESGEEPLLRERQMHATAAHCEAAWRDAYSGEVGRAEWFRRFALDADNAAEAMAHAFATGERVTALQIGATWLRGSENLPMAQQVDTADRCIRAQDDAVPPVLQVRVWAQATGTFINSRLGHAPHAARRVMDLVRTRPELQADRFVCYWALCRAANAIWRAEPGSAEAHAALAQARELEDARWPPHRRLLLADALFYTADRESPGALQLGRDTLALDLASGGSGFITRAGLADAELAAGDADASARTGEALLADLEGGRHEIALAYARVNLIAACLALGRLPRARALAQVGWPHGRLFDLQHWWADYLALLAALEQRPRAASSLARYSDTVYAARGMQRTANEAAAYTRACALARAALGEASSARRQTESLVLREDDVQAVALALEDIP